MEADRQRERETERERERERQRQTDRRQQQLVNADGQGDRFPISRQDGSANLAADAGLQLPGGGKEGRRGKAIGV